jgi:hypothetical protein
MVCDLPSRVSGVRLAITGFWCATCHYGFMVCDLPSRVSGVCDLPSWVYGATCHYGFLAGHVSTVQETATMAPFSRLVDRTNTLNHEEVVKSKRGVVV